MVHMRKDRMISFILAITLFLSVIYCDIMAEDVLFLCDSMGDTALCLMLFQADDNDSQIHSEELLIFCSMLHENGVLLPQGRSFGHAKTIQSFYIDDLITDYMHQSDGKK